MREGETPHKIRTTFSGEAHMANAPHEMRGFANGKVVEAVTIHADVEKNSVPGNM